MDHYGRFWILCPFLAIVFFEFSRELHNICIISYNQYKSLGTARHFVRKMLLHHQKHHQCQIFIKSILWMFLSYKTWLLDSLQKLLSAVSDWNSLSRVCTRRKLLICFIIRFPFPNRGMLLEF